MEKSILIVEDEASIVLMLESILQNLGHSIWSSFSSGEAAIEKIKEESEKLSGGSLPDLIMMDINLAGKMTGIETIEELSSKGLNVPVIYLTAYDEAENRSKAVATSPHAFLTKPPSEPELKMAIDLALLRGDYEKELETRVQERVLDYTIVNDQLNILRAMIEISVDSSLTFEQQLERILDQVISIHSIAILIQSRILLVEDDPNTLVLKAQRGLSEQAQELCSNVTIEESIYKEFGTDPKIFLTECSDEKSESPCCDMPPHAHYCIPILSNDQLIGTIDLCVKKGHVSSQKEKDFLTAVANVLSGRVEYNQKV